MSMLLLLLLLVWSKRFRRCQLKYSSFITKLS
jgi:hypothetical protein